MKILALAHKLERSYAKTGTFNHSKRKKQCEVLCRRSRRSRRHWQLVREMKKKNECTQSPFYLISDLKTAQKRVHDRSKSTIQFCFGRHTCLQAGVCFIHVFFFFFKPAVSQEDLDRNKQIRIVTACTEKKAFLARVEKQDQRGIFLKTTKFDLRIYTPTCFSHSNWIAERIT